LRPALSNELKSFIDGPVGFDFLKCQTFAASPAEPGELLIWFSVTKAQIRTFGRILLPNLPKDVNDGEAHVRLPISRAIGIKQRSEN
jgi:hypothetical protein